MNILKLLLFPLSYLYRFLFYLDQTFTKRKYIPNSFTISIGNLSVGGTGKTPFALFCIEQIQTFTKLPICVLSRGYKGKNSKLGMKVELDTNALYCGDEPLLIKKKYPHVEVIIGKKRYESFLKYSSLGNQKKIILLDDGFQHHALKRDYDFILIDSNFLIGNGHTLPYGVLREPLHSVRRANAVVFSKYSPKYFEKVETLRKQILEINPKIKIFYMYFTPKYLENCRNQIIPLNEISEKSLCVFSGIGNFESLQQSIQNLNPKYVSYLKYSDHHPFTEKEIQNILKENPNTDFICTEKDFVKFSSWIYNKPIYEKIYYLVMETKIEPYDLFQEEVQTFIRQVA